MSKKTEAIRQAKNYDELLDIKYGKIGTKKRNAFEEKAQYFVISEMLKEARKEAKKPLTANEKFEMKNKSLDNQIEMKAKMKKILNTEQMQKWEANKEKRKAHTNKMKKQHKNKMKREVSK